MVMMNGFTVVTRRVQTSSENSSVAPFTLTFRLCTVQYRLSSRTLE